MTSSRIVNTREKSTKPATSRMRSQRFHKRSRRRHSARASFIGAQLTAAMKRAYAANGTARARLSACERGIPFQSVRELSTRTSASQTGSRPRVSESKRRARLRLVRVRRRSVDCGPMRTTPSPRQMEDPCPASPTPSSSTTATESSPQMGAWRGSPDAVAAKR
jgi:hypothetical protein